MICLSRERIFRRIFSYLKKSQLRVKIFVMESYKCTICGYTYSRVKGDPSAGVPAGTAFSALPKLWECPVCGAEKDCFSQLPLTEVSLELGKRK